MYSTEDLFDLRSIVGAKVEQIIEEKKCTKAELSNRTGISRPTINKLLAGTLTSKANYVKHIEKVLDFLNMTPDMLMGKKENIHNKTKMLSEILRISTDELSKETGISVDRLKQIDSGSDATIAELRDIAMCLYVGVTDLLGGCYFESQISLLNDFVDFNGGINDRGISGFWGHVGILLNNNEKYLWFPITGRTKTNIVSNSENERIVIPCMNNKVLYLNMKHIKELILLDDGCDQPSYANWDPTISCGEIPRVVYESLEDYVYSDNNDLSDRLKTCLDRLAKQNKWSEEDMVSMVDDSVIHFADGGSRVAGIDFTYEDNISEEVSNIWEFGSSAIPGNTFYFMDIDESDRIINVNNIAMIELPLLKVEEAINREYGYSYI